MANSLPAQLAAGYSLIAVTVEPFPVRTGPFWFGSSPSVAAGKVSPEYVQRSIVVE